MKETDKKIFSPEEMFQYGVEIALHLAPSLLTRADDLEGAQSPGQGRDPTPLPSTLSRSKGLSTPPAAFSGSPIFKQGRSPLILALKGELGAGKTTFLKGFISTLARIDPHHIQSPTFTYLQIYNEGIYHFDLYRIKNYAQFESAGFADYLQQAGICCIEWPDRIESHLPNSTIFLEISYLDARTRLCSFQSKDTE